MNLAISTLNKLLKQQNGCCYYCGIEIRKGENLNVDHCIPKSKNGTGSLKNLVCACRDCNLSKSDKNIEEYRKKLGKNHVFYYEEIGLKRKGQIYKQISYLIRTPVEYNYEQAVY